MAMPAVCPVMILNNLMEILDFKATDSFIIDDNFKELIRVKTEINDVGGLLPAVMHIVNVVSRSEGRSEEIQAAVYQWTEYCLCNLTQTTAKTKVLNDLNSFFCDKTFILPSATSTVADIVLYVFLNELFRNLSFYEKEIYNHLSRWYKQVQYEANSKAVCPHVAFIKTNLYA